MTSQCCFCVPLKAGVVIVSLIWLIYGIYMVISNAINLNDPEKYDPDLRNVNAFQMYSITIIVLYGLMTIGAIFGLFTITLANTSNMLFIYTKIAYVILAIEIISSVMGFIVIILFSSPILLTYLVILAVFSITISVHFVMVISAYAHRRERKETATNDNKLDVL
ncbi:hypothetical protein RhiirA5_502138 [Rhizophagus irregularis]|uniref:Uncharacterized protein n=3 Tax=Rhizophagus irregularis TaxID=588596 RepID=U9T689_RHIID|nr:hypothetical protein GLOIN_2v1879800 [Rhizophagus irregularis DAOM 181602=DAOM 197198]PKC05402.1 hypothetical protein RhiirA5_502138 [Rhizophagus irregularis]PKY26160.1 hypothetical protein RhiirB3_528389 [Rhizophagus irregularis]POG66535.1 hypothetical protein GLOIN_2v1879800 [Rhizophagus irregularis DAOM 181602=DAOM 197198]UZO07380.1 hypothetical protein OCT59_027665 [Rhizophagus irregularis]CAB4479251.1 unnamed protein product [Rhizophagus irregularis]|eukprot:XP_025173401.1 hypothetical protein GLOIN_2v1879800 [Rhizophagus irregularis DAOM 181602=DAOM 197198]